MILVLSIIFLIVSFVYASAGLGGGSTYTAVLAISGIQYNYIAPISLSLNVIVSFFSFYNWTKNGFLKNKLFFIFILLFSVPGAFLGSQISVSKDFFLSLLGFLIIIAGFLVLGQKKEVKMLKRKLFYRAGPLIGFILGFIAGLVGIGGGVFLSPVLLLSGFPVKEVAAITSGFVLFNSLSGVFGHILKKNFNFFMFLPFVISVLIGGFLGGYSGAKKFSPDVIKKIIAFILIIIGLKLLLEGINAFL